MKKLNTSPFYPAAAVMWECVRVVGVGVGVMVAVGVGVGAGVGVGVEVGVAVAIAVAFERLLMATPTTQR
jgi:hypothetical protein